MTRGNSGFERPPRWAMVALPLLLIGVVVLAAATVRKVHAGDLTPAQVAAADRSSAAVAAAAKSSAAAAAPHLTLPKSGASVLFFGDSYTQGYGAQPETNGYAHLVADHYGWQPTIDAVSGTGYLAPGPHNEGTYGSRLGALPKAQPALVVLQGGLNDQDMKPTVASETTAAQQVIAGVRARYPDAQMVVFGPVSPAGDPSRELVAVDQGLAAAAAAAGVTYVSPVQGSWRIVGHTIADGVHPDNTGYRTIADELEASFGRLAS